MNETTLTGESLDIVSDNISKFKEAVIIGDYGCE